MMKAVALGAAMVFMAVCPHALAMSNYDDPRVILSYMDQSLEGARDILRLTTSVAGDSHLVFEVKTRAMERDSLAGDYLVLQVSQGRSVQLLVPIDPKLGSEVLDYELDLAPGGEARGLAGSQLRSGSAEGVFAARRVPRGVEYLIPLAWIDYREKIAFDAFTIRGRSLGATFHVDEIYDQAGKGRDEQRFFSPITLLNNLCATRK